MADGYGPIAADTVSVWHASLRLPPAAMECCRAVLSPREQMHAARLLRPVSRRRHIASWGQVRWLLGGCLDCPPEAIRFVRGQWGKPYLLGAEGMGFNFSHSGDHLVLAVGWGRALGVDVEAIRPLDNLENLARRCLAPPEWAAWRGLPEQERLRAFLRFWTCKEALAKAHGRGLGLGMQNCAFALAPQVGLLAVPKACGPAAGWAVRELMTGGEKYCAALCTCPGGVRVVERVLPPTWLSGACGRCRDQGSGWGA